MSETKKTAQGKEKTAPAEENAAPAEEKARKSIVPTKYAGKYKSGGSDELAKFINEQCTTKEGFDYSIFFDLCLKNGIAAEKVNHYRTQVTVEKRLGSQGRARMTLRNMLATVVRKDGKLKDLNGHEHGLAVAKPAVSGAAKKAAEEKQAA